MTTMTPARKNGKRAEARKSRQFDPSHAPEDIQEKLKLGYCESVRWIYLQMRKHLLPALKARITEVSDYEFELIANCERVTDALGSMVLLGGDQRHYQAVAATARLIFELVADFNLLLYYEDDEGSDEREQRAVDRIRAFEKAQVWMASLYIGGDEQDPAKKSRAEEGRRQLQEEIEKLIGPTDERAIKRMSRCHWLSGDVDNSRHRFLKVDEWITKNNRDAGSTFEEDYQSLYRFASQQLHGTGRGIIEGYGREHAAFLWMAIWDWSRWNVCYFLLAPLMVSERLLPRKEDRDRAGAVAHQSDLIRYCCHVIEGDVVVNLLLETAHSIIDDPSNLIADIKEKRHLDNLPMRRSPDRPPG